MALLTALIAMLTCSGQVVSHEAYRWKSVQMVGGGFVDGIVFHPTARGVCYARTDIGGAYRWDGHAKRWQPLLDWLSLKDVNLMGVESIALDPTDPNKLYMACGMYTNSSSPNAALLRSRDQGRTFERSELPFKMGGNENGRGNGERLSVDPNDGPILFLGSRHDGLWRSDDGAKTWQKVENFPASQDTTGGFGGSAGIVVTAFDPRSGSRGKPSSTIYAGVSVRGQSNLFRSDDAGVTWQPIPGEPTTNRVTRMKLAGHTLYVTYGSSPGPSRMTDGSVWKLDTQTGTWTDITPEKPGAANPQGFGYAGVSVDSRNPNTLLVSSFFRPGGEEIFRSTDGGASWRPVFHAGGGKFDFRLAPYVARTPIHWLFDVEIDPANPDHALFTTGYGGYETFDLTDVDRGRPTTWSVMSTGIEETVVLQLASPSKGATLVSAIGDYGGFVHWNLDKPAPDGNFDHPHFGNTTGLAVASANPDVMVRVGRQSGNRGGGNIGYSLDGGRTWQTTGGLPSAGANSGSIALSADGSTWIWSLGRGGEFLSRDRGATWKAVEGLPAGLRVVADGVNPGRFYALDLSRGDLYESPNAGATWTLSHFTLPGGLPTRGRDRGDGRGGQDQLYVTPGIEGDLWIAAFDGLCHRSGAGGQFAKMEGVEQLWALGFGKAPPRRAFPAMYLVGTVRGVWGVFRSDDEAGTWTRINDDAHQWGLILQVAGDPRKYGRVYVGTHGRGVLYGDQAR